MTDTGFQRIETPLPSGWRVMPVPRPDPAPPRPRVVRRDGTTVDLLATLGMAPGGPAHSDDTVSDWEAV